ATELIERSLLGPCSRLLGSDCDERALLAAHANLAAAGVTAELACADAATHAPRGVTLILTNPPMGRRVLRHAGLGELYDRFIDRAARLLVPGGRLVWISPFDQRTAARARLAGLTLEARRPIDMGGFEATIQCLRLEGSSR